MFGVCCVISAKFISQKYLHVETWFRSSALLIAFKINSSCNQSNQIHSHTQIMTTFLPASLTLLQFFVRSDFYYSWNLKKKKDFMKSSKWMRILYFNGTEEKTGREQEFSLGIIPTTLNPLHTHPLYCHQR